MRELATFQDEAPKRDAVKVFMLQTLREMAADRVLAGESVVGIREAGELVTTLFAKLDSEYGNK